MALKVRQVADTFNAIIANGECTPSMGDEKISQITAFVCEYDAVLNSALEEDR